MPRTPPPEERQLALVVTLLRARRPLTRAELWAALPNAWGGKAPAARRKFERDKRALRELGIELAFDPVLNTYSLEPSALRMGRVELSAAEAVLLRQAAAAAIDDPAFPWAPEVLGALVRLSAAAGTTSPLADPPSDLLVHHPAQELVDRPELGARLARVVLAVRRRLPLRFSYRHRWGGEQARRLEPWGVFCRRGRWSVIGRCADADGERTFRLDGMEGLDVVGLPDSGPRFERPPGFDPSTAADRPPWRFVHHDPVDVVLSVDPELAEPLARRLGHASVAPGDPRARITVTVTHTSALLTMLRGELPRVSVVAPDHVVEAWTAPLRRLLRRHGSPS